jgi:hypothetical protein
MIDINKNICPQCGKDNVSSNKLIPELCSDCVLEIAKYIINVSVRENRIFHTSYDPGLLKELLSRCDGSVHKGNVYEICGIDNGSTWRCNITIDEVEDIETIAARLIYESRNYGHTTTAKFDEELVLALESECDDKLDDGSVVYFWAGEYGQEWRVELTRSSVTDV